MDHPVVVSVSFVLILFGFGGRFYWAKRTGYLHDTWYHLLASEIVRENGHHLPERIDHFIFEGPYDYPPFLHVFLSLFPERWVHRSNWVLSPIVDLLHGVGLLLPVAFYATGDWEAAVVAVAIYAITPELFRHFTGLTPRVVGSFLFSVVFLSTLLGVDGRPLFFVPAILLGGILLLTHKMSSQTLAFVLTGFALLEGDVTYLLVMVGIIVAALALSLGHYRKVFRSHLAIINFWRIQRGKGNPPNAFYRDYGRPGERTDRSLLSRVKALVMGVDPLWVFLSNPWAIFLPVPLFLLANPGTFSSLESKVSTWALGILLIAVSTQYVPKLKLVGEGYKYFLWGTFPAALILGKLVIELESGILYAALGVLAALSVSFIYFMMQSRVRSEHTSAIADATDIMDRLREPDVERVMNIPPTASYPLAYLTRKKVLWHDSTTAYMDGEMYYPTPQASFQEIADEYAIDAVVIDKSVVAVDESDFDSYAPSIEMGDYLLLLSMNEGAS